MTIKEVFDEVKKLEDKFDSKTEQIFEYIKKITDDTQKNEKDILMLQLKLDQEKQYGKETALKVEALQRDEQKNKLGLVRIIAYGGGIMFGIGTIIMLYRVFGAIGKLAK